MKLLKLTINSLDGTEHTRNIYINVLDISVVDDLNNEEIVVHYHQPTPHTVLSYRGRTHIIMRNGQEYTVLERTSDIIQEVKERKNDISTRSIRCFAEQSR